MILAHLAVDLTPLACAALALLAGLGLGMAIGAGMRDGGGPCRGRWR